MNMARPIILVVGVSVRGEKHTRPDICSFSGGSSVTSLNRYARPSE